MKILTLNFLFYICASKKEDMKLKEGQDEFDFALKVVVVFCAVMVCIAGAVLAFTY